MASNYLSKGIKRSALAVALGLCFAGGVQAQSTSGDIAGNVPAASGSKVTLKSLATGIVREYPVDSTGRFRISALPIGAYELTLPNGSTTRVNVVAGQTVTADFNKPASGAATTLDAITVLGGQINAIDLTSTETRTTFTATQLNTLPVARDVTSVSLLTPGTAASSSYFGPASFGGASAAENSYYVNGFNVTNLYDILSFTEIPYQAIDQLDVQTGGYGARYGFSTGGVTSVNVKRGTNEFKGGISYTWTPNSLREQPKPVALNDGTIWRSYDQNESSSSNLSIWAGGPIVKDKLFFFALASYSKSDSTTFGARGSGYRAGGSPGNPLPYSSSLSTTANDYESTQPYWLLKLDWYLNDNNHIEYTGFDNTRKSTYWNYRALYSGTGLDATLSKTTYTGQEKLENGGHTDIFKWTSYLTDNLTMALQWGRMDNTNSDYTIDPSGKPNYYYGDVNQPPSCPYVIDYRDAASPFGGQLPGTCATTTSVDITGGYNKRDAGRIDFEWQLGDHKVSFGYSDERWKSRQGSIQDIYYFGEDYNLLDNTAVGDPNPPDGTIVIDRIYFATGGNVEIDQKSWYLEDNWNITDNFMLYAGIRNDSFENKNSAGKTFVKQDNIWQPRLGFTWDVLGNGDSKLYASAGRYSLPIAANVSLRAASASYYTENVYVWTGAFDPANGAPILGGFYRGGIYNAVYNGEDGSVPDAAAVADKNLKPYTQNEFILGYQQLMHSENSFLDGWQLGVKATYRKIVNAIDDTCDVRAVYNAAVAAGYSVSNWANQWTSPGGIPGCYLYNPGRDLNIRLDVNVDGHIRDLTIPAAALGPKAKRDYKAVTFSADKTTEKWSISASYTWSKLYGNLEGLVKSTNGQDDTGTTSDFDFKELMYGATGDLFNDHRHSIKVYGSYKFTPEWEMGFNILAQSGSPKSCLGGGLGSFGTQYGYTGVFHACDPNDPTKITPVGAAGRTPWNITVSPNVIYRPASLPGLSMQVNVLNIFNKIVPTQVYETTYGITASGQVRNYYNYGQPKFFNTPRYVRFQVQYDF
ncbi:TonB-dependent receptor [Thermomonas hydrothermalis]|uniref:TonB-dependent Receptor Plug Domain n=1 Tax=Thermomonas hydrothermalis TaxID=213588 RepID=A0A1M4SH07_9GAMM|nr:TonB-dependent receptor [Thermomonas hydrothermalis]SHE31485.1 TonB-dependent Receptor Plug Domain [Thermomonas hydrothermalis]